MNRRRQPAVFAICGDVPADNSCTVLLWSFLPLPARYRYMGLFLRVLLYAGSPRWQFVHGTVMIVSSLTRSVSFRGIVPTVLLFAGSPRWQFVYSWSMVDRPLGGQLGIVPISHVDRMDSRITDLWNFSKIFQLNIYLIKSHFFS